MKILLKDPSKVAAVIAKIHAIYPLEDSYERLRAYYIEAIKECLEKGCDVILEYEFKWDGDGLRSHIWFSPLEDIPTDEQYLNDNGNEEN